MEDIKMIDAHAHLNFKDFEKDRKEVIDRCLEEGIGFVNVGTNLETSKESIDLAKDYQNVYAIVGLHPTETEEKFDYDAYKELALHPKVVGIGECGLDYFRTEEDSKNKQVANFIGQIKLAKDVNKPLMLHIREGKEGRAYGDVIEILQQEKINRGNVHFFAGNIKEAQEFLDLGFFISFTGVITFAKEYEELIKFIPLDKMLIETDCPFVAPVPHRGKRNEPLFVKEIAKKIAEIKNIEAEEVARQTTLNWRKLFQPNL